MHYHTEKDYRIFYTNIISMVNKLLLIFSLAVFFSCAAYSQGTIKGCVKNTNSVPMCAIVVYLISENSLVNGASTDYKGEYLIENISAGTYDIVAESQEQYINYNSHSKHSDYGKMFHPSITRDVFQTLDYTPFILHKYIFKDSIKYEYFVQMLSYLKKDINSIVNEYFVLSIEDENDGRGVHSSYWSIIKDSELFAQYDPDEFVGFLLYGDTYFMLRGKEETIKRFFDITTKTERFYHIPNEFPSTGGFVKWNFEITNNLLEYDGMEYCE